jgi:hypothetical protein
LGSDGRGKAQWLGVQEGKLRIFIVGGGGIAFIFRPDGLNQTICPVAIVENMTIKRRTTDYWVWAETAGGWRCGFVFLSGFLINF